MFLPLPATIMLAPAVLTLRHICMYQVNIHMYQLWKAPIHTHTTSRHACSKGSYSQILLVLSCWNFRHCAALLRTGNVRGHQVGIDIMEHAMACLKRFGSTRIAFKVFTNTLTVGNKAIFLAKRTSMLATGLHSHMLSCECIRNIQHTHRERVK